MSDAFRHVGAAFRWPDEQAACSNPYIVPTLTRWLRQAGAVRVLDLGCGNGALTNQLAQSGFDMTGVDASESGIRIARRRSPGVELVHAWLEDPLPKDLWGCFDTVVSIEVIEHLFAPRVVLERAREALQTGGRLLLSTPYHAYLKNLALAFAGRFDRHCDPLSDGGHIKFFSKATLSELLRSESFMPLRVARVGRRIAPLAKSMLIEAQMERR
jgi:2-polyprenyl-3-methyl-5-hydroxy-6-metoxy-1,4-benzoquinol methylase